MASSAPLNFDWVPPEALLHWGDLDGFASGSVADVHGSVPDAVYNDPVTLERLLRQRVLSWDEVERTHISGTHDRVDISGGVTSDGQGVARDGR
eukprot:m.369810 g.369810  ORF g.369810 m.369810 type:complete len:94 (+) comp16680_c1_seq15:969-1250(+)